MDCLYPKAKALGLYALFCNGQEISRTEYADLFSAISTTYGEGDGSTTFNLPNLQDKFPMVSSTKAIGTFISPGLPNITGSISEMPYPVNPSSAGVPSITGAFKNSTIGTSNGWADGGAGRKPVNNKNFLLQMVKFITMAELIYIEMIYMTNQKLFNHQHL